MKRNWLQTATLVLCAVLLAVTLEQKQEITDLRVQAAEEHQAAEELAGRLEETDAALQSLRESQRPVSVSFANPVVNTKDRTLTVDVVAELPGKEEYSFGIGLCRVGEPYRMAWKRESLSRREDGTYAGTVSFPVEPGMGLELRLEDDTVLFSSDSISELLPLQLEYGGTSWHYSSEEQIFYQCDWGVGLTDPAGNEVRAQDGEFRVYRNEALVFTGRQMPDNINVEVEGEPFSYSISLDCVPGDRMRLCYACTDDFGLRYEFPLFEKIAMRWDDMEEAPLSRRPAVTWPE